MSQENLGKLLSTTGATISRWELGQARIQLPELVELAHILAVSPSYLLTGAEDSAEDQMMTRYLSLSEANQELVRKVIAALLSQQSSSADPKVADCMKATA